MLAQTLKNLDYQLSQASENHAGYPYNLNFSLPELETFLRFSLNNLGDPFTDGNYQIGTRWIEREVVQWLADLYHLPDAWGYVTHSGTEGNLQGILMGREKYPNAVVYCSEDTHYSIKKACYFFGLMIKIIPSQTHGEISYLELSQQLDRSRPAIVVANIGTTFKGAIDDVDQLLLTLTGMEHWIHCDGGLGGMLVPYQLPGKVLELGFCGDAVDRIRVCWVAVSFRKPIDSLCISGHKFIGLPIPCGIFVARQAMTMQMVEYVGSSDTTLSGSRNGFSPLILWTQIEKRRSLFDFEAEVMVRRANQFQSMLAKRGIGALLNSCSCTVVFPKPIAEVCQHYQLATLGELAHIVVMQNHSPQFLEIFANQLSESRTVGCLKLSSRKTPAHAGIGASHEV